MNPDIRTIYELQPIFPLNEWWHWLVALLAFVLLAAWIVWLYRKDTSKLDRPVSWALMGMRLVAVAALLIFILGPVKRTESKLVKDSRVAVLVDTSLSMGLRDDVESTGGATRVERVVDWVESQRPIQRLRQNHEVTVYRFDDTNRPEQIASFGKQQDQPEAKADSSSNESQPQLETALATSQRFGWLALLATVCAVCGFLYSIVSRLRQPNGFHSLALSIAMYASVIALVLFAYSDLWTPRQTLAASLGFAEADFSDDLETQPAEFIEEETETPLVPEEIDWEEKLAARGGATKLGSAIESIVSRERAGPIAGIVVITDGQGNKGVSADAAMIAAANAGIPVYPIGIGSTQVARNAQVADLQVPPRVFPGDRFKVKALITAFGLEGTSARVRLFSVDSKGTEAEVEEDSDDVRLGKDGEPVPVSFEVTREKVGKRRYLVRLDPVNKESESRDNQRDAIVRVIERKTNVLLMAGGPTREFRFLRNQLYRDQSVTTHVWLQSAKEGADQESDVLLNEFPTTRDQMYFFDCIVAFDPDWRELSSSQTALLERWVAEQAGGLVLVAGPVNTPEWTRKPRGDSAMDDIRKLYPVSFYSQGSAIRKLGRFGGAESFPLQFTREGKATEYLWIGDSASKSSDSWSSFDGVFGYYAVNESKAGADVLAYFADPNTLIGERLPIYFASQFYGAGRAFFQASGEMWRVRRLDVAYFEEYYNKLIRWASQGRLLRDSRRGVLLADRERCWMGDTISLQAILRDAQDQPMTMEQVEVTVVRPDDTTGKVTLRTNPAAVRPGTYSGQFIASVEGEFRVTLPIPDSPDFEALTASVTATIPDLEKERPQRNDALLTKLAEKTQGHFYVGLAEFSVPADEETSPENMILTRDQESLLSGTVDQQFKKKLLMWLMGLLVLAMSLEWTVRRLHRLA